MYDEGSIGIWVPKWLGNWLKKFANRPIVLFPEIRLDWLFGVPTIIGPLELEMRYEEQE